MKRFYAVLAAIVVAFCFTACKEPDPPQADGFLLEGYSIVYDAENDLMYNAAKRLQTAIKGAYNATAMLKPDTQGAAGKEIVLGDTDRGALSEGLLLRDFKVDVSKNGGIAIGGGQPAAVSDGVDDFIEKFLGTAHAFTESDSYVFRYDYAFRSISINGEDILDYTVVYSEASAAGGKIAADLSEKIADKMGVLLDMRDVAQSDGGKEIRIGVGDETGNPVFSDYDYALYADGDDLVLNATEKALAATDAGEQLLALFDGDAADGVLNVSVSTEFTVREGAKYSMEFVSARRSAVVREGVNLYEFHYKNKSGKPVIVYAAEIKADSGCTFAAGTVNDGYEIGNNLSQSVLGMAKSAQANGKNVVCAVNSGFFAISGDQHQEGVIVKDGKVLYQGSGVYAREWWGLTKSGEIVFGEYYDLYVNGNPKEGFRDDLMQATAGNHLLWKDGEKVKIEDPDTALLNANPRSCFLTRENGDAVIFVADGRYSGSAGLTMEETQEIAMRMGAYNALNLDGGGSSTLVMPTGASNALQVVNKPLGNAGVEANLRKVADSILVLVK